MTTILLDEGLYLDIFTSLPGFENEKFEALLSESAVAEIEGIPVRFLHINQLIQTKKVTNRPKDQIDVQELEKIKKHLPPDLTE